MYPIERGVQMPAARQRSGKYPLSDLQVTESFLVPADTEEMLKSRRSSVGTLIHRAKTRTNKDFTTRAIRQGTEIIGIRVWRTR